MRRTRSTISVLNYIDACMLQNGDPVQVQVWWGPQTAQTRITGSYGFLGAAGGCVGGQLQLTLTTPCFTVTHTVHTLPPSPSCLMVVMVASLKDAVCIYNVSKQCHTSQHAEQSSDNGELIKLLFFYNTLTSLRHTWHDPSQDSVGHTKHFSWEPV